MGSRRQSAISQLAELICAVDRSHPVRVAINGGDAAGKTMLADELVALLQAASRKVVRASVDDFLNPRSIRYKQGANSPEGYYQDSFNNAAIVREVLMPLGPDGTRQIRRKIYDLQTETPLDEPVIEIHPKTILLFDGVFLLRPELRPYWDFSIFIEVDFAISVSRAVARDVKNSEGKLNPKDRQDRYNQRYVPGQQLYFVEAQPRQFADVIFDNNDIEQPILISNK